MIVVLTVLGASMLCFRFWITSRPNGKRMQVPDTFRAQTILGTGLGIMLILFGLLKMATHAGQGTGPFIALGAVLMIAFGAVRPAQRRDWLKAVKSEEPGRLLVATRLLNGPAGWFWRTWMHLDADGGDRDAKA